MEKCVEPKDEYLVYGYLRETQQILCIDIPLEIQYLLYVFHDLKFKWIARINQAFGEAMQRRKQQQEKEKKDKILQEHFKNKHEAILTEWEFQDNNRRNLLELIQKLSDVLPSKLNWKPISMTKSLNDSQVKKAYFRAIRIVHVDKSIARSDDIETRVICIAVFQALKQSYNKQFI